MPLIIHLVQVLLVICEKSVKCKNLRERSYTIEGPRLPAGATHKLKPSPSTQLEPQSITSPRKCQLHLGFCIGFLCGSVLNMQSKRG